MTKQTDATRVTIRETRGERRGRLIVAEIHSGFLVVRLKGTQQSFSADWASVAEWLEMREAKQYAGDIPSRKLRR